MGTNRGKLTKTNMLAACIRALFPQTFPHKRAVDMTAKEVISEIDFDHDPIPHAEGGSDEHHNLTPRLRADHRKKTAEEDIPRIAKNKRIAAKHAAHKAIMDAKIGFLQTTLSMGPSINIVGLEYEFRRRKRKIPSRGFPQEHRPLRSRNNLRRENEPS